MNGRPRRRWRLWFLVLVVVAAIGLLLALVLPKKLDAPSVQPTEQSNDWKDTLAKVERVRSVPRLAVKPEPMPEQRVALSVFDKQVTQREEIQRIPLAAPSPAKPNEQPSDAGAESLTNPNLLLMRKLSERLKRMQTGGSSAASK